MNRATVKSLAGLACAMLTLGVAAPAAAAAVDRPRLGDVQKALSQLAKNKEIVGAIGAVYVDGRKAGKGSAGTRLLNGKGGRIPAGARFRVGSQTKLMTQVVIMKLVTEGKLSLDDKLSDLLPVVVEKDLVERADEITVEQMIHHTSGIPNWYTPQLVDAFDFDTYYPPLELVKKSRTVERTQEPGEKFSYSNTNYMLLGLIIEDLTRHSVSREFERRIFDPLHMDDTYLPTKWPGGIKGPHGHGYHPDKNGKLHDVDRLNMSYGYAAGGVISTTDDLGDFHRAFARDKILTKREKEALNAGRPAPEPPPGDKPADPRVCGEYGLVKGGSSGFSALTYNSPDGRVQFVLSATLGTANTNPAIDPLVKKAAEAVLCPET
ncbi:class A beta-lactamase-related serine hydrolase [Nonomuraea longispora]|uniref:Class A beta-lactamase-related serine hydrolase n=1 Tax=Nonomuraea longispora TaxID=1848320 RepID=A0A4R4MZL2_9ACTN|nr:serine hydrolase domain-containing protein [Nonomuraea longispora]TDC00163.1 class A beta-lactamase-related serine hydrolase [Nonomuraea longispora]